ncbi:ribulose-phosphate 3-epimerase [Bacteroidota bacterium]
MKYLAPSILSADFSNLSQQIKILEKGKADIIHCDIMDGRFVPNITFGPLIVRTVRKITDLPIDVHLMIKEPDKYIEQFVESGADYISVHQEEVVHLNKTIIRIKELGIKAGVVLNPSTPVITLNDVIDIIDFVLVMSVNPGFGGQKFIISSLKKINELFKIRYKANLNFDIEVDGGVDINNIENIKNAGCDIFVIGSSIFDRDDLLNAVKKFRKILSSSN